MLVSEQYFFLFFFTFFSFHSLQVRLKKKRRKKNDTHTQHHQQYAPVGGLFFNGELKNENDLKYRLERISSCHQDATVE